MTPILGIFQHNLLKLSVVSIICELEIAQVNEQSAISHKDPCVLC